MTRSLILLALICSACGASSPAAPSTPTPTPAPPVSYTVSGIVTATNGGQALSGLAVTLNGQSATTNGGGGFSYAMTSGFTARLALSGATIVPRALTLNVGAARTASVGAIALNGGFDLNFYRQFVRNTLDAPAGLEPVRRWTVNPSFYMKVTDEAGVTMDAKTLDNTEQVIRAFVAQWTAGQFGVAAFDRGTAPRAPATGWINVNWSNVTRPVGVNSFACGDATVGQNPGTINLYYKAGQNNQIGSCRCAGQSEMGSRVVSHELGHAMGFWHAGAVNDVMFPGTGNYCDATLSARERLHAAIAYARPVGNTDPDSDPTSAVTLAPMTVR